MAYDSLGRVGKIRSGTTLWDGIMAKGAKKDKNNSEDGTVNICRNRRAAHDYEVLDRIECGLVLVGTEVKSLRAGYGNLEDAYARVDGGEVWLIGAEIPEYEFGNRLNHKPKRPRKLLLHKREIVRFAGKAAEKGLTLVPLSMYFKVGVAKVELAIAKGKQTHDKREALKKADAKRQIDRALVARRKK
ncbi:MAG TPA: SsrA-binding protein SmpB [Gemmata sp.]|jgi:SsrA-binding protein|nr:SsrA-binding protein SmpB [Gemmata sp.]